MCTAATLGALVPAVTSYDPTAFRELLALAKDTEWSDPLMRSYYPNKDRLDTLLEAYNAARDARTGRSGLGDARPESNRER